MFNGILQSVVPEEKPVTIYHTLNQSYWEGQSPASVHALIPKNVKKVLDVGCGIGLLGRELRNDGADELVGIELVEDAAKQAKDVFDKVYCCNIEDIELDCDEGHFDCIVYSGVLEHLHDPHYELYRRRKNLSDNGTVVALLPNVMHYSVMMPLFMGKWAYQAAVQLDSTHYRFFTAAEIMNMFKAAGYKVEECRGQIMGETPQQWLKTVDILEQSGVVAPDFRNLSQVYIYVVRATKDPAWQAPCVGGLEFTGERMIIGKSDRATEKQHLARYQFVKKLAAGKRVLDAGCGSGYGSHILSEVAESVTGIDIAAEAIECASKNYSRSNLSYLNVDATNTGLPDQSFDMIVSFEVVEHIPDPGAYLSELKRLLKPGGSLVISTPNRLLTSPGSEKPFNPFHVYEWTMDEFKGILAEHFDIKDMWGQQSFGEWAVKPDGCETDLFFLAFCRKAPAELKKIKESIKANASSKFVSVVIPAYNQADFTRQCLRTLYEDDQPKEVILVDNGSTDATSQLTTEFPALKLIRNEQNMGFAAACNQGITAASGDYVLLLNNDTLVPRDAIRRLLECAESDPRVGIAAPMSNKVRGRQKLTDEVEAGDYQKFSDKYYKTHKGERYRRFSPPDSACF
jgi:2-polyprenyl-3-methyl-5-hydroxy-6-metoxy-1,4-benzoquinol methylase